MSFPRQIIAETQKLLRSNFILTAGVLVVIFINILTPFIVYHLEFTSFIDSIDDEKQEYTAQNLPISYKGQTYEKHNILTSEMLRLFDLLDEVDSKLDGVAARYAQDIIFVRLDFLAYYSNLFDLGDGADSFSDYRSELIIRFQVELPQQYLYRLQDPDLDAIAEIIEKVRYVIYESFDIEQYKTMSENDKNSYNNRLDENLDDLNIMMLENDFSKYVEIMKHEYEQRLEQSESEIMRWEKYADENPLSAEHAKSMIRYIESSRNQIIDIDLPILEYRLENNITPNDDSWQNRALKMYSDGSANLSAYTQVNHTYTEEEYNRDPFVRQLILDQYGSYRYYEYQQTRLIETFEWEAFIAKSSLETGKPDMALLPDGARQRFYDTLNALHVIMFFALLTGGQIIASEHQVGTIRLLMIRPRGRTRLIMSKYLAGLFVIIILYFLTVILGLITQGALFGFEDYLNQNHLPSGEVYFFSMLIGDVFAMFTMSLFIYSAAFACSTLSRNVAIAIFVPTLMLVASLVLMQFFVDADLLTLLNLTPLPHISLHHLSIDIDSIYSEIANTKQARFIIISDFGAAMNVIYSAALVAASVLFFKKRDV